MSVLVVDDERNIRQTLRICLEAMDIQVSEASSAELALAACRQRAFDLVFLDLRLGTVDGLELLPVLLAEAPQLPIVIITAHGTVETAVAALKRGACDYVPKPFAPAQIRHVVEKVRAQRALSAQLTSLEDRLATESPEVELTSQSPAMRALLEVVARAAESDAAVLFRGESGTGKGVLARALHFESKRRDRPFVTINCPTLTGDLLASELFGHAKGAFTGAVRDQPGRVEAAEGGTLFLDEIGDLGPLLQAKLLRFLQERRFERVGEGLTRVANVRVLAATNRDLERDVRNGHFREDLLFRLNVVEVYVPPLRERREDIVPLARRFLGFFAHAQGHPLRAFSAGAEEVLAAYPWPGNVRELRNVVERAAILWPSAVIEPAAFPERLIGARARLPFVGGRFSLDEVERAHITSILARSPTLEEAAVVLGIDTSTLWRKRKRFEDGSRAV